MSLWLSVKASTTKTQRTLRLHRAAQVYDSRLGECRKDYIHLTSLSGARKLQRWKHRAQCLSNLVTLYCLSLELCTLFFVHRPIASQTKHEEQSTKYVVVLAPNADGTTSLERTRFRVRVPVVSTKTYGDHSSMAEHAGFINLVGALWSAVTRHRTPKN